MSISGDAISVCIAGLRHFYVGWCAISLVELFAQPLGHLSDRFLLLISILTRPRRKFDGWCRPKASDTASILSP